MYGSTDTFLFDRVDKVILSLDLHGSSTSASGAAGGGTFTYASKIEMMNVLRCNEDEFLDMGLLLGFEYCPTFPPLVDGTIPNPYHLPPAAGMNGNNSSLPNPRQALDVVRQYRSGFTACSALAEHATCAKMNYTDAFCRARCMIKFCLVTSAEEGRVLPLPLSTPIPPSSSITTPGSNGMMGNIASPTTGAPVLTASDIPVDLHEIFSHRLPDEVFLHLSRGLLSNTILNYLISGMVIEGSPLDDGDTEEWRAFVRYTITESPQAPRCVALALMASSLNGFWSSRKMTAHYHFDQGNTSHPIAHDSSNTLALIKRVNSWNVSILFVEEELRRQGSSTIDIALCLGATGRGDLAEQTKTPRPAPGTVINKRSSTKGKAGSALASSLEKKDELVANIIWRFLELRGFLNHDHLHTPYARALHLSLKESRLNDKFQEPLYIALEMIRSGFLHDSPYRAIGINQGKVKSGGPSWGDDACEDAAEREMILKSRRHLLLIMRTLSILPMNYRNMAWKAPLSRELIQFNSFVKLLNKNLRMLIEVIASNLLLRGTGFVKRNRDDYLDISLSLPFQTQTSTGLGIVIKCYLEALLTFNSGVVEAGKEMDEDVVEAREAVISMLEGTFANVKDVRAELTRGLRFWSAVVKAIEVLQSESSISPELMQQFTQADEWLRPMSHI